jgi:protein-tyrosine phosphatase
VSAPASGRAPGAQIVVASVPNLRDVGGWPTSDGGVVRRGLVYRSTELADLRDEDVPALARLGIRFIYDLRTDAERAAMPDRALPGAEHVVADVMKDVSNAVPAQLAKAVSDPAVATPLLDGGKAVTTFEAGYRMIVSRPSALAAYHRLFSDLAGADHRPALFHCTTGKDRTGWAAAALLNVLGVSSDDVLREYLLTNEQLLPALQPVFDRFRAAGGDPDLLLPVLGVRREYLEAAFDETRARYGTMEAYFRDGLGIDDDTVAALRAALVERG